MDVNYEKKDKLLLINFTEEIDHHTTEKIRRRADYEIERYVPRKVIFDFDSVTFMDSSGIGLIIGNILGITKNICMPEMVVYEYIKNIQ